MKHKTLKGSFYGYFWNVITDQYSDFQGRCSREDYWMFLVWFWIVVIIASIVSFGILGMVAVVAFFIPNLAIGFRRFHDLNWPGWWIIVFYILAMIPLVNLSVFYWIYLFCQKGDEGTNDYGKPVS
ncbi:DUF805 domain-containing protein [Candidatus Marinimicrobia bacterium]|nr:DUF805 domain-containing protein [Candidatus Neomarinimicrobiota bacterium]